MMKSRVQTAVAACSCIVVAASAVGCGEAASAAQGTAATARAQDSAATAAQAEPLSLVVQMTGLLLLVPPKNPTGNTQVLMPDVENHVAVIGFKRSSDPGYCDVDYDKALHICYVNMNGWSLAAPSATLSPGGLPKGAVNLTRFAGKPVNLADAIDSSRAVVALAPGLVTDTCSLASWTFNPVGNEGPERLSFVNVMEWIVPAVPGNAVTLVRTSKSNPGQTETFGPLQANDQNEVELLVMHLPTDELNEWRGLRSPGSADRDESEAVSPRTHGEMRAHFNAFYNTMGVQQGAPRPVPQRPRRLRYVCPITILGLDTAFAREKRAQTGTKTLSCVMTSAAQG